MYFGFLGILSLRKRAADKLGDSIREDGGWMGRYDTIQVCQGGCSDG